MSYCFIAQIKINDEIEYQKYVDRAGDIFKMFNGKYLAVDNMPIVLEGRWNYTRTVLISFETKQDFDNWYNSKNYQEILKYRINAANCDTILVKGLANKTTKANKG